MEDKILKMFFEYERWKYAIDKGVGKDINRAELFRLCNPQKRVEMCQAIIAGRYKITPPHTAKIPKDKIDPVTGEMEYRTVYVNEPIDRVFLSIANDLLFELCPEMIHKRCFSYLKGIGCGKVVEEMSAVIAKATDNVIGWKSDLSKYFDSVPIEYIDKAFDDVEAKHGHSAIIDVLRDYYHCDLYWDTEGNLVESYQSLKQGCSVASWLADKVLYDIDEQLSKLDGCYARYSDDTLFIGRDHEKAMLLMREGLAKMQMKLNDKKVDTLYKDKWFTFLGYSIKGNLRSISNKQVKTFQKEIMKRTIKAKGITLEKAIHSVVRYLYVGDGKHSWATSKLQYCNCRRDILTLSCYILDALRAVETGKKKIGGLGYMNDGKDRVIVRGKGKNVKANRQKTGDTIDGFVSLLCMQKAKHTGRSMYNAIVQYLL